MLPGYNTQLRIWSISWDVNTSLSLDRKQALGEIENQIGLTLLSLYYKKKVRIMKKRI